MNSPIFNRLVTRQIQGCRYFVYGYLLACHLWFSYQHLQPLSLWVGVLIVMPALVHLGLQRGRRALYHLHIAEALALPGVFVLLGAELEVVATALISVVVCNALLWGGFSLPVVAAFLFAAGVLWELWHESATLSQLSLSSSYAYVTLLILIIATIAQRRTERLALSDVRLQQQNAILRRYLPEDLWSQPGVERRSERGWMTIVFIDLCGFTSAVDQLDAELVEEFLNDFFVAVTTPIQTHQGCVHKFLGDGVLCVFRPDSSASRRHYADLSLRAVAAIMQSLKHLNRVWCKQGLPRPFDVSVGISSGFCTVGDWGTLQRMDYTVVGGPVNLASRLQEQAPPGAVYMDAATARLLEAYRCEAADELAIRGLGNTPVFVPLPG
ncbi:MAG: adenylate/guanylate cyclase domain-containing protein [Pseudomonadales bacterium]